MIRRLRARYSPEATCSWCRSVSCRITPINGNPRVQACADWKKLIGLRYRSDPFRPHLRIPARQSISLVLRSARSPTGIRFTVRSRGSEFRRGHPSGQQSLGDRRVQTYGNGETRNDLPALLIFDRKASGNSKPLRVIRGPKTQVAGGQQMAVSPKGWIVGGARGNSIGVWSVFDDGDVPPRWRIPVKQISGLNVNGIALDPAHQELMVPTGNGNTVMTFYFPEIF